MILANIMIFAKIRTWNNLTIRLRVFIQSFEFITLKQQNSNI